VASCWQNTSFNFLCDPTEVCYGSGFTSTDPDNNIATESVNFGTLTDGEVCFTPDTAGVYTIIYTVTDSCGESDQCQTDITISFTNQPPVCNLPDDGSYFVCGDTTFSFPISATDPDGNLDDCIMTSGSGSFDGSTWTFTTTAAGVYSATFECDDSCGATCGGTVNITVAYNQPPQANCPANTAVSFLCDPEEICLPGFTSSDPDANIVEETVSLGILTEGEVCFTPDTAGVYTIIYTVRDACDEIDQCQTNITVTYDNEPPVCNLPNSGSYFVCGDTTFNFSVSATDPNNNLDSCSMTSGPGSFDGSTWTFTTTAAGVYSATFECVDSCGATCGGTVDITVTYNQEPVCDLPPSHDSVFVCGDTTFSYTILATDVDNNLVGCTMISGDGSFDGTTWTFTTTGPGTYSATFECEDSCGATCGGSVMIPVIYNVSPVCSLPGNGNYFVCGDTTFTFPVSATDADNNLVGCSMTSGVGSFDGSTWTFTTTGSGIYSATFECVDACGATCGGTVDISVTQNIAPTASCPPDTDFSFLCTLGQVCYGDFSSLDLDDNIASETVNIGTLSNGEVCFTPNAEGVYTIIYTVTDSCDAVAQCQTDITVSLTNRPPVCNIPTGGTFYVCGDTTVTYQVSATDPDNNLIGCTMTPGSDGSFDGSTWTLTTNGYGGYSATFVCEDACGETCSGTISLIFIDGCPPPDECPIVKVEKTHNSLQGHFEDVSITIEKGRYDMGGFDLLLSYDATALTVLEANPGQLLVDCGWEHFTYRFGSTCNECTNCPTGMLRLIALAETMNGPNHPSCYGPPDVDPYEIAVITFMVTNNRLFECQYVPIRFFWCDCGDNTISNINGDSLFLDSKIYDFEGNMLWDEDDDDEFPEDERIPYLGAPDFCLIGDKVTPTRCLEFIEGGIDIVCADSIDARGDVNVNGVVNEVADAVMLTNYFIGGLSAFGNHVEASIAASDINADGIALSVADLVYLVRVIIGDANPYAKPMPSSDFSINTLMQPGEFVVEYDAATRAGAALLVFEVNGSVGQPIPGEGASNMDVAYGVNGNELRVLVYDIGINAIAEGEGILLRIPIDGDINLVSAEVADYYGTSMNVTTRNLPKDYELSQNFPNPFNPRTRISLSLPGASDWSLSIYNIAGQMVKEYDGYSQAGTISVSWDGTDMNGRNVASGIYIYKASAGEFTATRKMILMK
jgi:hypothetical protein